MRNATTWWIIALVMFLLDLYVYQALRLVSQNATEKARMVIHIAYWVISALTLATI